MSPLVPHFLKPRGGEGHKGRWEHEVMTQNRGNPVWAPGLPQESLSPSFQLWNPPRRFNTRAFWGACCLVAWDTVWGAQGDHLGMVQDHVSLHDLHCQPWCICIYVCLPCEHHLGISAHPGYWQDPGMELPQPHRPSFAGSGLTSPQQCRVRAAVWITVCQITLATGHR